MGFKARGPAINRPHQVSKDGSRPTSPSCRNFWAIAAIEDAPLPAAVVPKGNDRPDAHVIMGDADEFPTV
jgi:hypothetical protein